KDYLELKGKFDVTLAQDGDEALMAFRKDKYDLCIFDVMMPKKDGFSLGKDVRKMDKTVPIIYATAKGMMEDKTQPCELGSDDSSTTPCRVEELLLTINALLQRVSKEKAEELVDKFEIGDYFSDHTSQIISFKGQQQKLSTTEAELLRLLCLNK